jgi:hypothetical protein
MTEKFIQFFYEPLSLNNPGETSTLYININNNNYNCGYAEAIGELNSNNVISIRIYFCTTNCSSINIPYIPTIPISITYVYDINAEKFALNNPLTVYTLSPYWKAASNSVGTGMNPNDFFASNFSNFSLYYDTLNNNNLIVQSFYYKI